jgi:hypothetical protein
VQVSEAEMPARITPAEARTDAPPADADAASSAGDPGQADEKSAD